MLSEEVPRKGTTDGAPTGRRYIPLGVDLSDMDCLVVGGGRVAERKVRTLLNGGARVTVLSPGLAAGLRSLAEEGRIIWRQAPYEADELAGCFLVIAATSDPALNVRIGQAAKARGVLHCVVSPGRFSQVIFPAAHHDAGLTVAVHSDGRNCGRARQVRDHLARSLRNLSEPAATPAVFGLDPDAFPNLERDRIAQHLRAAMSSCAGRAEWFLLETCRRVEAVALTPWPAALARDLRTRLHRDMGVMVEGAGCWYAREGVRAYHHLLRVASGLDSPLIGETDVAGQARAALEEAALPNGSRLREMTLSVLVEQRHVRRAGGEAFGEAGRNWAATAAAFLEQRLGGFAGRTILMAGCGRLAENMSRRLAEGGAALRFFSARIGGDAPAWCAALGGPTEPLNVLPDRLAGADALALSSVLPPSLADRLACALAGRRVLTLDLTGRNIRTAQGGFSFKDVGVCPASGEEVEAVARAECEAMNRALAWAADRIPRPPFSRRLRIAARGSRLSRAQLDVAMDALRRVLPGADLEPVFVATSGDRDRATPLTSAPDDFFTREIDQALLRGEADIALHSAKDLPRRLSPGLCVAACLPSPAPWECLVSARGSALHALPPGSLIGTSSARRQEQALRLRPDCRVAPIRGDVPDRVAQVDAGRYDAIILAAVGLVRLGMAARIAQVFPLDEFPPEPGQGALALVTPAEDAGLRDALRIMDLGGPREGL